MAPYILRTVTGHTLSRWGPLKLIVGGSADGGGNRERLQTTNIGLSAEPKRPHTPVDITRRYQCDLVALYVCLPEERSVGTWPRDYQKGNPRTELHTRR